MSILSNFLEAIKPKEEKQEQNQEQETKQELMQDEKQETKQEKEETLKTENEQEENKEHEQEDKQEEEKTDNQEEKEKKMTVEDIPEDLLQELYSKFKEAQMTKEEKQERDLNDKLMNSLKTYSTLELKNTLAKSELPVECEVLFKTENYINGQSIDSERLLKDVENIKSVINKITDTKVAQIKKELFADKEPNITKNPVATGGKTTDFDTAFNNLFNSLK